VVTSWPEEVGVIVHTHAPVRSNVSGLDQRRNIGAGHAILVTLRRRVRISPFWQHFLEMFAAMGVGMAVGVRVFLAIAGPSSYRQALLLYPVPSLSAMALSMALPMVAWMLFRGHGWRNSAEMAAAMLVPAIPFIFLAWLHVIDGTACCAYMPLSTLAMLGVMFYRRDVYSMPMRSRARKAAP
jgi:hypothetical protein